MSYVFRYRICKIYLQQFRYWGNYDIYTELVTQQERTTKGNRLHDTKKTYYKNVYITVTNSDETLEELFIKNDNHLIVKYSVDEFWDVYKCSEVPSFKPKLYHVNPKLTYL